MRMMRNPKLLEKKKPCLGVAGLSAMKNSKLSFLLLVRAQWL